MKSRTTNEFSVLYLADLTNSAGVVNKSCKIWNPTVLKQLGKKLAQAKETKNYKESYPVLVDAYFQNGSTAYFLFIPEDLSVFELHEALRDDFFEPIKQSKNISFNVMKLNEEDQRLAVDALTTLSELSQWSPPFYGKNVLRKNKKTKKTYGFYSDLSSPEIDEIMNEAMAKAKATNEIRTLAMMPPNVLGSEEYVKLVLKQSNKLKFESLFYSVEDLKALGAGAFLAVVRGSASKGGIIKLHRPSYGMKMALVGKGVVYDTGGHDLKTDSSMYGMHRDMTGSAVAFASFKALSSLESMKDIDLSCYLAVGENLITEKAYKSGEVIQALNGETIEIKNTDAEGRLMLADTLFLANKEKPNLIIDFATLTGSALDVLGDGYAIAMSNDEKLHGAIRVAGKKSGERVWPLPINDEFEDEVTNSEIADLSQCTEQSHAEHSYAGAFLNHFVSSDIDYVHVDLACEKKDNGLGLVDSDVTGFGVRWLFDFIKTYRGEHDG